MMLTINQANAHMDGKYNIRKNRFIKLRQSAICLFNLWVVFLFLNSSINLKVSQNKNPSKLIDYLSENEQKALKLFFRNIFADKELGYTLFGDKPMSFCFPNTYPPVFSKRNYLFKLYIEGTIPFAGGLAAWKKLKVNLDKDSNYSLIIYEEKKYPTLVILINKIAFEKEVGKNIDAFKSVYGCSITPKKILKMIEDKIIDQDELFNQHLLLGITLGYGRHSSELFQRRWSLAHEEYRLSLFLNQKTLSDGFSCIEDELEYLSKRLQNKNLEWYINTCPLFLRVTTVVFAFDSDDPEAQSLIKKYKESHARLTKIFDKEDWLEAVLTQLSSTY